jgi:hypothetical protein
MVLLFAMLIPAVNAETWQLHREQWSGPRSGERILAIPVLRQVMASLAQNPKTSLLIRYPGGEDGIIWVSELEAWLVALGMESSRIETRPGSPSADIIELEIVPAESAY